MKTLSLALILFSFSCASVIAAEEPVPAATQGEMKECFDWFAKTGVPDLSKAKWAEVVTSYESQKGRTPQKQSTFGFALSEDGKTLKLLTADMDTISATKGTTESGNYKTTIDWQESDFATYVKTIVAYHQQPQGKRDSFRHMQQKLSSRQELFFLAYASQQRGNTKGAGELFELAKHEQGARRARDNKERTFREELEMDFGHVAMWRAVLAFSGGDWGASGKLETRKELLKRFQDVVCLYPASEHMARAKSTVATLEKMVAEDDAHREILEDEFKKMPVEEQVKELIFRLRDQNGHQYSQPGWCDIFSDSRGEKSPAHMLAKIGYLAVPRLIEALDDERFSRSVGFHRNFHFSHTVLTVGDCALTILQQIAGQGFFEVKTTSSYMSKEQKTGAVKKAAQEWWTSFQSKGEKAVLIEGTEKGDRNSDALATRLLEKYRDEALEPILKGAKAATDPWVRQRLTSLAAEYDSPKVTDFLHGEMTSSKKLVIRVNAASLLRKKKPAETLTAMVKEWRTAGKLNPDSQRDDYFESRDGLENLIHFLVSANSPEAIAALGEDWTDRGVEVRLDIIQTISAGGGHRSQGSNGHRIAPRDDGDKTPRAGAETIAAAEKLLVSTLSDTTRREGMSGSWGDFEYSDPRLCDMALYALHEIFPDKYTFTAAAAARLRDEERTRAINSWRREHGQKEIATTTAARPKLPPEQAYHITTVTVNGGGLLVPDEFKATMDALQGRPITADVFVALLAGFFRDVPNGFHGVEVTASRESDLTGVDLVISLLPGKRPAGGQEMDVRIHGEQAARDVRSSWATVTFSTASNPARYKELHEGFEQLMQTKPEVPFTIRAAVRPKKDRQ